MTFQWMLEKFRAHMNPTFFFLRRALVLCGVWIASVSSVFAAPTSLVIVHTNDIHDHLRAREDGEGGLPYVASFVSQLRREVGDVLFLDGGDITEKGDLVSAKTHGLASFQAMALMGYHAVAIGNHDLHRVPLERVRRYNDALGNKFLCANFLDANGHPVFEPSRLVKVGEVQVGLVGLTTVARDDGRAPKGVLDLGKSGAALGREARKLKKAGAEIVVAVCHEGTKVCAELSQLAPEVAVFISAHSHEVVRKPIVAPGTGALIVQAGSYARWAGLLKVEIERGRVVRYSGSLIEMSGKKFAPDATLMDFVAAAEREHAPEASVFVIENTATVEAPGVGRLGAEALRVQTGADIAFCLPSQVVRDVLPAGRLDYNSFYRSVGLIGANIIEARLTGAEIAAHFAALQREPKERPTWSGFTVRYSGKNLKANVEPTRTYRVVMPRREWNILQRNAAAALGKRATADLKERGQRAEIELAAAMRDYLISQREQGAKTLQDLLQALEAAQTVALYVEAPADEMIAWSR